VVSLHSHQHINEGVNVMKIARPGNFPMASPRSDPVERVRNYLGGRRGLFVLGGAALTLGIGLNWGWLAAIGVAPILLALLPCAVMCALGLCMHGMTKKPSSAPEAAGDAALLATPVASPARLQLASSETLANQLAVARQPAPESTEQSCCHTVETQEDLNAKRS
jgi:hypothetical protein